MAYDDGYYYGQCKIVAVVDNTADNGKTVLITTDDNKTYSGTIANKKCEFLLPPRTLYTVQKVSDGSAEFTTKVEAGYGDCILVHLDTGYVEVKQGDIVGLDYIKAATADDLKNKVPEANAVKELNSSLANAGSVKYNEETDSLDVYQNGIVIGSIFCGFQFDGIIYDTGQFNPNYFSSSYTVTSGTINITNTTYLYSELVVSANSTRTVMVRYDFPMPYLNKFSKLMLSAKLDASDYAKLKTTLGVGVSRNSNVVSSSNLEYFNSANVTASITEVIIEIDLFQIEDGNYYLYLMFEAYDWSSTNTLTSKFTINKIWFE